MSKTWICDGVPKYKLKPKHHLCPGVVNVLEYSEHHGRKVYVEHPCDCDCGHEKRFYPRLKREDLPPREES